MARLSKEEHNGILEKISTAANLSPETMDLIDKLRSDFDESLSVDTEEVAKEWNDKLNAMKSERDKAIGERDESRRAYRERFFTSNWDEGHKEAMETGAEHVKGITEALKVH